MFGYGGYGGGIYALCVFTLCDPVVLIAFLRVFVERECRPGRCGGTCRKYGLWKTCHERLRRWTADGRGTRSWLQRTPGTTGRACALDGRAAGQPLTPRPDGLRTADTQARRTHPLDRAHQQARPDPDGIKFAVFYTMVHSRLLRPLTAADQPQASSELRQTLDTLNRHVDHYISRARLGKSA
jgi:hypothetical protein